MRQLFLPACVCLVTWSGTTNPEARFTLDEFTGKSTAHAAADTTGIGTSNDLRGALRPEWRGEELSTEIRIPDDAVSDAAPSPAIEIPAPSGVVNSDIPGGIPLPPIAKQVVVRSTEEICDTLTRSAQINNLPAPFLIRLLFQESGFNPGVISSAGAQGIAQFMPDTATDMGLENPFDPRQAIPASARLLSSLVQKFGNLGLAAAAYNAGPKRVSDWLGLKGKGKLPDETQGYVKIITGKPVENWTSAEARHPGAKLQRSAPCQESAGLLAWNGPDTVPMPQPAPLRIAQEKQQEKPALVANLRLDMKHADRAEREAAVARTARPVAKRERVAQR
jgi:hypothetical protein